MNPIHLDELTRKFGSRYGLVIAAAKRARQLKDGAPPLVDTGLRNPISIALEEITASKVLLEDAPEELLQEIEPRVQDYLLRRGSLQDQIVGYTFVSDEEDDEEFDEELDEELEEATDEDELDYEASGNRDLDYDLEEDEELEEDGEDDLEDNPGEDELEEDVEEDELDTELDAAVDPDMA